MGLEEHRKKGPSRVKCAVIVTSDERNAGTDESGSLMRAMIKEAGHELTDYRIVKNEPAALGDAIQATMKISQAIIVSGGTGISARDITVDTVEPLLERKLSGFGEFFRHLSYEEIGTAAMLSRAVAGSIGRRAVFCVPGSVHAVRLAMERLILPELSHIVGELEK